MYQWLAKRAQHAQHKAALQQEADVWAAVQVRQCASCREFVQILH